MNNDEISVVNENSKTEVIKILKYFKLKNSNKKYIIYKNTKNNSLDHKIYASEIIENEDEILLKKIEDKMVVDKIEDIIKENKNRWKN